MLIDEVGGDDASQSEHDGDATGLGLKKKKEEEGG